MHHLACLPVSLQARVDAPSAYFSARSTVARMHAWCCSAGAEAEAEAPAPSSLRSVLPAALSGPAVQRCDHCTRGIVGAWDTEAGVVASAYWLGGAKAAPPHSSSGSAGEEKTGSGDRDESAGWRRGLSQLQSAAAMGVQVATHPTDDGTTLQLAAHVLPGAPLAALFCRRTCNHRASVRRGFTPVVCLAVGLAFVARACLWHLPSPVFVL